MGKKTLTLIIGVALFSMFIMFGILTAAEMPTEDIALTVDGATKPLAVKFSHEEHKDLTCTDCHHVYKPDDKGEYPKDKRGDYKKPMPNEWKEGMEVKECKECHVLESDKKKQKEMKTDPKMVRSLEDAFHDNCVDCHKATNKEKKLKGDDKLPATCNDCHEK